MSEVLQNYIAQEHEGRESKDVKMAEEEITDNAETKAHLRYGKICLLYNWEPKDSTNDDKMKQMLDLSIFTRVPLPKKEATTNEERGYPECANYTYSEVSKSTTSTARII